MVVVKKIKIKVVLEGRLHSCCNFLTRRQVLQVTQISGIPGAGIHWSREFYFVSTYFCLPLASRVVPAVVVLHGVHLPKSAV